MKKSNKYVFDIEVFPNYFCIVLKKLNDDKNITIILVTHELDEVMEFTKINRTYEIKDGKLMEVCLNKEGDKIC